MCEKESTNPQQEDLSPLESKTVEETAVEDASAEGGVSEETKAETSSLVLQRLKGILQRGKNFVSEISFPNCLMRLAGVYLLVSAFFVLYHFTIQKEYSYKAIYNWHEYRDKMSLPLVLILTICAYILFTILKSFCKKTRLDSYILVSGLVLFSLVTLWRNESFYYTMTMIILTAVVGFIGVRYDKNQSTMRLPLPVMIILIAILGLGVAAFIATFTIYRHELYGTAGFDMGIFVQMYHSMITDLSQVTTCEREKFMSHFAVHCSPIYYVLLPFYYFFPYTQTLLVAQAILVASGVIPLVLICRKNRFTNITTLFFSITYLFCAELIGPCFYEFHENAFLPALLMWLFYAIESEKRILLYVFTGLVLCVKEDAPIYVVCIGLYLLLRKDKKGMRKHGAVMAAVAAAYFVTVTSLMGKYGEGVMTSRTYGNLMIDWDAGFGEIIQTVILDPAYFLSQVITEENMIFFLTVMLPLGMMPFFTKKFSRLLLFVPFFLMNLASGYGYARDIGFQYVFGTSTCLIYATIINCADLRPKKRQYIAAFTAMATVYMSMAFESGKVGLREIYEGNHLKYEKQDELLASIPEDASVACDSFYIPRLANRKEIYHLNEEALNHEDPIDFVIVRLDMDYDFKQPALDRMEQDGYTYYNGDENIMAIYMSPSYEGAEAE